ncbi:phosphodiester glycosidase family protein [Fimbriimonas ginsengisoli]|uniref:Copper amine oxidase-like domain-containing protein n=1 Tax=Fimbriimonas ginsengisoli Gsoil 348 TaxID=661478 RepID=A0A068NRU0_FIMGI|nr:phosphodiester glycosidase family protein [Fimbriimonas ginsengisoli]AIE86146.1 copper amine oxidase-like domain-containing protein [Fimbriimonas ginsengisoli Gsoil 348]
MRLIYRPFAAALLAFAPFHAGPWRPAQVWEKTLAPGLVYRMEVDPNLPRTVHALRISPGSPVLRWSAELAGKTINEEGTVKGKLTPTLMAVQSGAIAAVNGDFFSYDHGAPIGQMVRAGELITTATRPRAVFGWGPKDVAVGFASSSGTVDSGEGSPVRLESVNQPVSANGVVLYTPAVGIAATDKPNVTLVLKIADAHISPSTSIEATLDYALPDSHRTPVPAGRALLIATGDAMAKIAAFHPGERIKIRLKTDGFDWEKYENVIGGGPVLLRDGDQVVDAAEEGFKSDFLVRHPRTAIGKTPEGDVWIVTVDGRQACSVGATLEEMAQLMKRLGCVDAINLDGGGSSALNLFGVTVNRPSDGVERPVANGILIFGPRPAPTVGARKILVRPNPNGTLQARVEIGGKPVENADVLWTARGAAWIDQGGLVHPIHAGKARILARAFGEPADIEVTIPGAVRDPRQVPAADRG